MNKYNIRAIRKGLDDCIRTSSWKHFRSTFSTIQDNIDLCKAVIEYRSPAISNRKNGSLLHALCHCTAGSSSSNKGSNNKHQHRPPVPYDIIETIVTVNPHVLYIRDGTNRKQTPLHICIDRGASPHIIECLLQNDKCMVSEDQNNYPTDMRRSLYIGDQNGDTPLMLAVLRSSYYCDQYEIIKLLLKYDVTKQSLLMERHKRKRTPLWYVAVEEIPMLKHHQEEQDQHYHQQQQYSFTSDDDDDYYDFQDYDNRYFLPEDLQYMLLQTCRALQIQQQQQQQTEEGTTIEIVRNNEELLSSDQLCDSSYNGYCHEREDRQQEVLFENHGNNSNTSNPKNDDTPVPSPSSLVHLEGRSYCLLQSTISCAHLLGKHASTILQYILQNGCYQKERLHIPDKNGNMLLHYACEAIEPSFELNSIIKASSNTDEKFSVDEEDTNIDSDRVVQDEGDCSPVNLIEYLVKQNPEALRHPNCQGQLPLHISIQSGKTFKLIQYLMEQYPKSAGHHTNQGELPLHLAILQKQKQYHSILPFVSSINGKEGDTSTSDGDKKTKKKDKKEKCKDCPSNDHDLIRFLWGKAPETATLVHGPTHLYAFQLAACNNHIMSTTKRGTKSKMATTASTTGRSHEVACSPKEKGIVPPTSSYRKDHNKKKRNHHEQNFQRQQEFHTIDMEQLNTIYFFLRESPQIVQHFLPT